MATHPVSSSADPKPVEQQPSHPLPDVTAPHDTAAPPKVAEEGKKAAPAKQQQQGAKKEKKDKKAGSGASAGPLELTPPPEYFEERIKIFDEYMEKYKKHVAGASPFASWDERHGRAEECPDAKRQNNPARKSPSPFPTVNNSPAHPGKPPLLPSPSPSPLPWPNASS